MKGRIEQGGSAVYDSPVPGGGRKVFHLAPGTAVDVLESYGDFYAVRVFGRSEPAYIHRSDVDIVPDWDRPTKASPPEGADVDIVSDRDRPTKVAPLEGHEDRGAGEELAAFVVGQLAKGKSKRSVVAELVNGGWPEGPASQYVEEAKKAIDRWALAQGQGADRYMGHMVKGFLWAAGGGLLTAITYSAASSNPGGGTYYIFYGAIAIGAIQFLYGLVGWLAITLKK